MEFPERFSRLPEYAFPRLRALLDAHAPGGDVIHMSIGEPKHPFPPWISKEIAEDSDLFNNYPPNEGTPVLRQAFCNWVARRYGAKLDPDKNVMPLNGTREGLYNVAMALCPSEKNGQQAAMLMPNPFYQVYMVAAISVDCEPFFIPATPVNGFLPDFSAVAENVLKRTVAAYICSPSNPQGAVATREYWRSLFALAEKHDFPVFADECYSELYRDTPPVGALEVAQEIGADPERVLVFHSLSKRSNLPGLRSGFVAGGPESIARIKLLRAYAGAPLSGPLQSAASAAWADEAHVEENRALYQEKYVLADELLGHVPGYEAPEAGFFLWLPVEDGETATLKLWKETGVRVLPGEYLARDVNGFNPGKGFIRVAMVAPKAEMARGLEAIRDCLFSE